MKKIVFVMPKLGGGGAERVVSTIIRHLNKNRFKVYLILIQDDGDYLKSLDETVEVIVLPITKVRYAAPSLIKEIRKIHPDIIFSTIRGMSALISLVKPFIPKDIKIVFREMNTPSESLKYSKNKWLLKIIYKTLYKRADKILCQSNYMKDDFINTLKYDRSKLIQIYNPIDIKLIDEMTKNSSSPFPQNESKCNVISIGRLSNQKWYEQLINSLVIAKEKDFPVKVWVLGEGPLKNKLIAYASELDVKEMIDFVGRKTNPYIWMKHADLFVLHSRYEGLPNVLLEAISTGCPPIVTDHPGGTKEIMQIAELENRIKLKLEWEESWFERISKRNINQLVEKFSVEEIIKEYESFFENELTQKEVL